MKFWSACARPSGTNPPVLFQEVLRGIIISLKRRVTVRRSIWLGSIVTYHVWKALTDRANLLPSWPTHTHSGRNVASPLMAATFSGGYILKTPPAPPVTPFNCLFDKDRREGLEPLPLKTTPSKLDSKVEGNGHPNSNKNGWWQQGTRPPQRHCLII